MPTFGFERFPLENVRVHVSICRTCGQFIAAAPDQSRLEFAEHRHDCPGAAGKSARPFFELSQPFRMQSAGRSQSK